MRRTLQIRHKSEDATHIIATRRRVVALNMRAKGYSIQEIAEDLDLTAKEVATYVEEALLDLSEQSEMDAAQVRSLELIRFDAMLRAIWEKIEKGEEGAIAIGLGISRERRKLLGLDAPVETKITGKVVAYTKEELAKVSDEELAERARQLAIQVGIVEAEIPDFETTARVE